ncbi:hypothetical protein ACOMHN_024978 [Nucella lapillus]
MTRAFRQTERKTKSTEKGKGRRPDDLPCVREASASWRASGNEERKSSGDRRAAGPPAQRPLSQNTARPHPVAGPADTTRGGGLVLWGHHKSSVASALSPCTCTQC